MDISAFPPLHGQLAFTKSSVEFEIGGFGMSGMSGFPSEREPEELSGQPRVFTGNDGEEAIKCLRKAFQVRQKRVLHIFH